MLRLCLNCVGFLFLVVMVVLLLVEMQVIWCLAKRNRETELEDEYEDDLEVKRRPDVSVVR